MSKQWQYIRHLERQIALQPEIVKLAQQDASIQTANALLEETKSFVAWNIALGALAITLNRICEAIKLHDVHGLSGRLALYLEGAPEELAVLLSKEQGLRGRVTASEMVYVAQELHTAIQSFQREEPGSYEELLAVAGKARGLDRDEYSSKLQELIDQGGRPKGSTAATEYLQDALRDLRPYNRSLWETGKALFDRIAEVPESRRPRAEREAYLRLLRYMQPDRSGGWYVSDKRGLGRYVSNLINKEVSPKTGFR